jgi:hypothetical protein
VGLHNKYPSYFYKRGNLFNTYLSHTDEPEARSQAKPASRPKAKPASRRHRRREADAKAFGYELPPSAVAAQLGEFARDHMSPEEALRFLELVAADCGVSLRSTREHWQAWMRVSQFASKHLSEERTIRFLRELERRRLAGQPLIRR